MKNAIYAAASSTAFRYPTADRIILIATWVSYVSWAVGVVGLFMWITG